MRPSLRAVFMQAIKDYVDLRDKIRPDYNRLEKEAPAELLALMSEMDKREAALDKVWIEARPEMNAIEVSRHRELISFDPDVKAGRAPALKSAIDAMPATAYPQSVLDVLERVRKVFPGAKIVAFAKPGEEVVLPKPQPGSRFEPVQRSPRPEGVAAPVQGIQRFQPAPIAEPIKPADPEQPRLL